MSTLSLKISLEGGRVTKTIQFDPQTTIFDACKIIRDKFAEAVHGQPSEYGLFLSDEEKKQGVWLEAGRILGYYLLRNQDLLEYRRKLRTLRVRMLDGAVKTILVDDSQPVSQLMVVICTKIGITNHDEYGLVREDPPNENQPENNKMATLTLRRKVNTDTKERDTKMDNLRKKLRTDDEINWVDVGKTLREQGIDESETVLLRRKFFFSDQNIDSRDPVQLNLLYVQARDAILDVTHPVTQDKACEFAGIQAHIQFGDYNEQKHKPGFLDLKEFLPQSYVRIKNIEKKIFGEQKTHIGLSEIDAKVAYTKTARELPTYGVTFFLVKEKMSGKNKLVPRLLGVTKDSVLRLDERTKEILRTWPLTTVRRWGASPNTFTLDFGDYADQYYSVQTTEAEQIVQLIAGYIDIILKKKQSKDHFGIEGDEGSTMVEESVAPSKATFLTHNSTNVGRINTESVAIPVIMRGSDGERSYTHGDMQSVQYGAVIGQVNLAHQPPTIKEARISSVLSEPQRALLSYIATTQETITRAESDLMTKAPLPDLGNDAHSIQWRENTLDTSKQAVTTHIATMNAATAQVVTATQPDEIDHDAVGAAVSQIAQSIPEVTKEVRLIAALMDDDDHTGDNLLDTARKLCSALSNLLRAAEPESKEPRQTLLNAASRVGEASGHMLYTIGEETDENRELQDMLLALAKAVANTTAALVLRAKSVAAECDDDEMRNRVIGSASQCALATSQLVACAKVVAPTIHNAACRDQLEAAAREVANTVSQLVSICNLATNNPQLKGDLLAAAQDVSRTLTDMLEQIRLSSQEHATRRTEEPSAVESVLVATDLLVSSTDPHEMVRQARALGQATAHLIQSIKGEADDQQTDSDMQRRLLGAAKQLADATAKLVEAARLCASSPNEPSHQEALRTAAEELRDITTTRAHTPAMKRKLIQRLEYCAKQAASASTECITAARNAVAHSHDQQTKEQLLQDCGAAVEQIPRLINGLKSSLQNAGDQSAQLGLIEASEQFIESGTHVASSARAFHPTVHDSQAAQQLLRASSALSQSIHELAAAAAHAREACGGQELESALEAIQNLRSVLNDTRQAAAQGELRPLPGESAENCSQLLCDSAKGVGIAMSQLLSAVSHGERLYAGAAGRDTALALGEFVKCVRGVVASGGNAEAINCADEVVLSSVRLVEEAQRTLQNLGDPQILTFTARDLTTSLSKCVECLPGQREVDAALKSVSEINEVINMGEYPPTDKSFAQLQAELKTAADQLNDAGGEVAKAYGSPAWLATVSQNYSVVYRDLLQSALEMAGQTRDGGMQSHMVNGLRGVSVTSISLLSTAKSIAADPNQPNAKHQLTAAARQVTESINNLVDVCTQAAPGQKECDSAIRSIEALRQLLDYPKDSYNDQGYYDCVETATEKSRSLGYAISGMINNAKQSQHVEFGHAVNQVTESIQGLIQSAAQSAYLIGVAHSPGGSGRPGIIDQAKLARSYQGTRQNCDIVASPNTTKQQKITALTVIAKHTSYLCLVCRQASLNTSNPVAKNEFIEGAKLVANTTSDLVQEVKGLNDDYSAPSHEKFVKPLLGAVNSLCQYASSPEFLSVPVQISAEGRRAQEPILQAGRGVLDGVIEMVRAAKSLAVAPDDPPVWQQLAMHSKPVSESVKRLVDNIRDKAPGQTQCDQVLETLANCHRQLDAAGMTIGSHGLPKSLDNTLQGFAEHTLNSSGELLEKLEPIKIAAKMNAEHLGHAVGEVSRYIVPLTTSAIGACSHVVQSSQQVLFLDQTKSVVESARELVMLAKDAGGNPRATQLHPRLDEAVANLREAILDLNATTEKLSTDSGAVTRLIDQISRSMSRLNDRRQSLLVSSDTFVDFQTRMVQAAKNVARLANEMSANGALDPSKLTQISAELTQQYTQLAQDSIGASYTTSSPDSSVRIKSTVLDLGRSIVSIIKQGNGLRADDSQAQAELGRSARDVNDKVSQVLAALQAGSRGTQACINAASTVSGVIGDLDTTIMFATAGTLNADNDGSFGDHREHILKTAKALVEDTKVLVAGAAGSQDQLAAAAQNAVTTILQLADAVKRGACTLGSSQPDSQVMVINAVKDVAAALGELINATKLASGKPIHDPAMQELKESARVMVLNVSTLLKTVKAVEDEHTRGTRAMEATVEAISQEIRAMQTAQSPGSVPSTPEDLMRVTKLVTNATAKAVAAGASNQQADIVAAANLGRRAISEMLVVCKSVAWSCAETQDVRHRTLAAGSAVAIAYRDLLQGVLKGGSADERMHASRRVAMCVTDLVAMAQLLKGSDWVDPEDPTVIAENELLGAAASIDAAAKKLANLRPRKSDVKEADTNMQFDEMILEAARGIMAASSALVRAANAAQRELIDQGKVSRTPLTSTDDGQWSEGLISAARLVAAATHSLVEAAQNLVQGVGTEEMLISSAKQVAASTAQLLIACKVKADPNSESGRRLQAAGNAVIKSTDNLVRSAQRVIAIEEEHSLKIHTKLVDRMAQEINARSEVYKMQRQLDEARNKLTAIQKAKYENQKHLDGHADGADAADHPQPAHQYPGSLAGAGGQPQHYHIAAGGGAANLSQSPQSPSFHNASSSTSFGQQSPLLPRSAGAVLTANAVPRPYQSGAAAVPQSSPPAQVRSYQPGAPPVPPPPSQSQLLSGSGSSSANWTQQQRDQYRANLDAHVQDLHQKTFGSPQPGSATSTFKTTRSHAVDPRYEQYGLSPVGTQNGAENYTSHYETTRTSNESAASGGSPSHQFAQLMLNTDGGQLSLSGDSGVGSSRLASMTQRVMERQTVTTSSESHSEKKSQQHSYRLN